MAVIGDTQRKQAWLVNANGNRITELLPGSSAVAPNHYGIRTVLSDGDGNGGVPSGIPSERAELQRSRIGTYDQMQWWRWVERFDPDFAQVNVDRWCIVFQFHGSDSAPQPYLAWEVVGLERRLNCNGGQSSPRYLAKWPLERGTEVEWRMGVLWSTDPNRGRIIVYRNGLAVGDWTLRTAYSAQVPYPKIGIYRNAAVNGTQGVNVWGLQCHDNDPGPFPNTPVPPPIPDPVPDPEPPPPPTPAVVTIVKPSASQIAQGDLPYDVRIQNPPAGGKLYVGIAPAGVKANHNAVSAVQGSLDLPDDMDSTQWFYAAVHDQAGALVQSVSVPVNVDPVAPPQPPPPPPPPPPPVDPLPGIRVELQHAASAVTTAATAITEAMDHIQQANRLASD